MDLDDFLNQAPLEDLDLSATLAIFCKYRKLSKTIMMTLRNYFRERDIMCKRMLDIGCGYGYLTSVIGKYLAFEDIHGIDIDDSRIHIAKKRGINVHKINVARDSFPFPDNNFSLITSFGVLEHLNYMDNVIKEAYRCLEPKGVFLISTPNLGSWINRLLLLFGYQPRDVEISNKFIVGVHKYYGNIRPVGHVHPPTLKGIKELLIMYRFTILRIWGTRTTYQPNIIFKLIDSILANKASLATRFFIMAEK